MVGTETSESEVSSPGRTRGMVSSTSAGTESWKNEIQVIVDGVVAGWGLR